MHHCTARAGGPRRTRRRVGEGGEDGNEDEQEEAKAARARGYDMHRFRPAAVGVMFINLQIANTGWVEHKEWDAVQPGESDSDDEGGDGKPPGEEEE